MRTRPEVCGNCGITLVKGALYCRGCGLPVAGCRSRSRWASREYEEEVSDRSRLLALLLCIFVGYLGIHRFYVGKIWSGLLWLLTGGLFGVGYLFDLIWLCLGRFRDKDGLRLVYWNEA